MSPRLRASQIARQTAHRDVTDACEGQSVTVEKLAETFTAARALELAGPRSYPRGVLYHREGRVEPEAGEDTRLRATVRGSMPYVVELWVDDVQPRWSCTCPAADDGAFCKHCVAVALSLGSSNPPVTLLPPPPSSPPAPELQELVDFVEGLPRERLEKIVLGVAETDWRLGERLLAEARAGRGVELDIAVWRSRIDDAFAPYGDFVSYREAEDWASDVGELIGVLEELADTGHPVPAVLLAEYAHRRADEAVQYVDDSDGWLTTISTRLADLHLDACTEARPDPVDLADRLVDLELTSELDGFHRAAATHAEVLGPTGLAEYRRQLEPRWENLHADPRDDDWSTSFAVRQAMVGWALGTGDPDALIEVYSDEPLRADAVLEVARSLADAGREDEAADRARRGLDEFGDRPWQTGPLREFLAELLRAGGDTRAAVELFWEAFEVSPSMSTYRRLLEEAGGEGGWSDRCVSLLRARLDEPTVAEAPPHHPMVPHRAQALIEILLYEGCVEEAWAAATTFDCDQRLWHTLARAREDTHPLDAVGVYEVEVLDRINQKKTPAYRSAVELMSRIRRLAGQAGEPERFATLLERVRTEHRAKRNLKKLLDDKGW